MPLREDASPLVDERQAASEVVAEDCEQRLQPAPVDDRLCEALVHLERLGDDLELLVREMGEDRLRDRDERHLVGNRKHRKAKAIGFRRNRFGHLVVPEAKPKAEARDLVLDKQPEIGLLALRAGADREPGRQQKLASTHPGRRIRKLGRVQPADLAREALGARDGT